jgi:phospholipase C
MDGWLRTSTNDIFSIGYYAEEDLPLFSTLARNYTMLCNYFPSVLSSTFPNRIFQHATQTDRLSNTLDLSTLPTIWDRLQQAGVSSKYYYSNVPFLALWGLNYIGISDLYAQFLAYAAAGTLPAVRLSIHGSPFSTTAQGTTTILMLTCARGDLSAGGGDGTGQRPGLVKDGAGDQSR